LHLLELARAENEVAGGDLVAETLADLGEAERRLLARRGLLLTEVDEDALGRFGAQVVQPLFGVDWAEVGLEQAVEHARLGPLAAGSAARAGDICHRHRVGVVETLLLRERFLEVILTEPVVATAAF